MNGQGPSRLPHRMRVIDELGMPRSLPEGPETFSRLGQGAGVLVLGLGPNPAVAVELAGGAGDVIYVEAPEFEAQTLPEWRLPIPDSWRRLGPRELRDICIHERTLLYYTPNQRLFPTFWGPVLAYCKRAVLGPRQPGPRGPVAVIPGDENSLLIQELSWALNRLGYRVALMPHNLTGDTIRADLGLFTPALFLSVNFKGLDPHGEVHASLTDAGIPAVVWCVDNPFHLLSGVKASSWMDVPLCVTDDWFIPGLRKLGAQNVHHLPLAAGEHFVQAAGRPTRFAHLEKMTIFVGRPGFPDKLRFFSGLSVPDADFTEALGLIANGGRADFGWWMDRLRIDKPWPGKQVRLAGYGAEQTGLVWRVMCLREAARGLPLAIFGPSEWRTLLPEVENVLAEVDYYGALKDLYRDAAFTLNLTSPLLPRGLTQRHFDVWAAGGFLLTDNTPGLDLFPPELAREVAFKQATDIAPIAETLTRDQNAKRELAMAWRAEILARHTYTHRVRTMLDILGLTPPTSEKP